MPLFSHEGIKMSLATLCPARQANYSPDLNAFFAAINLLGEGRGG